MNLSEGQSLDCLDTPCLLVDLHKLEANIESMASLARARGVNLRPHIKSHKTPAIARRQLAAGAVGVTVAKLGEAEVMAAAGVHDILVAYQVVGEAKIARLLRLGAEAEVCSLVDDLEAARRLGEAALDAGRTAAVMAEIDTGLGRCGLQPGAAVLPFVRELLTMPGITFRGLLTHAGHAYGASDLGTVAAIGRDEGRLLVETAGLLRSEGILVPQISVGSTPTVAYSSAVPGVTEIRPGNYVFHDAVQTFLGVTTLDRCSLSILAGVVSRPAPDRAVIDAGSKALTTERGAHGSVAIGGFGLVKNRPEFVVERLSEEHGILRVPAGTDLRIGERLEIIPNHACAAVNLFDQMVVVMDGRVAAEWKIEARGQVR